VIRITKAGATHHDTIHPGKAKVTGVLNEFAVAHNSQAYPDRAYPFRGLPGIALHGFASPKAAVVLHGSGTAFGVTLIGIYLTVASILSWLVTFSGCAKERLYFALCASSATFGLLRTIFGDVDLPLAQYLRVAMLTSAVAVGTWILRSFSRPVTENALPD